MSAQKMKRFEIIHKISVSNFRIRETTGFLSLCSGRALHPSGCWSTEKFLFLLKLQAKQQQVVQRENQAKTRV